MVAARSVLMAGRKRGIDEDDDEDCVHGSPFGRMCSEHGYKTMVEIEERRSLGATVFGSGGCGWGHNAHVAERIIALKDSTAAPTVSDSRWTGASD